MEFLKVLQISTERSWRGGEQQLAYLIEEALRQQVKIVVAVRIGSAFEQWCVENKITHYSLGFGNGLDVQSAWKLKTICSKEGIQLVHAHSGKGMSIVYLSILMGLSIPVVVHRRVDFPIKSSGLALSKYNHRQVRSIICVSEAIRKMVSEVVVAPSRVVTVHSGIDFSRFHGNAPTGYLHQLYGIPAGYKLVANVAALAPHKDYFTFLDTAAIVLASNDNVHFLAIGDGELKQELREYSEKLGISSKVTFTGFRNDIPNLLREIDVFLITSITEGLGTSIIDAMYNGLPVVATCAGGIPELVEDGVTGFLAEVKDSGILASNVLALLNDENISSKFGNAGHKKALGFTQTEMASKVLNVYKSVI